MSDAFHPAAAPQPLATIGGYHAHIYYDPEVTRDRAALLRERLAERFSVQMGRWHDRPVGPHPAAMYQVAFDTELFAGLVPWLMLNRLGLTVLVHPETGHPRDDHLLHALWLGAVLPLDASGLPMSADPGSGHAPAVPNTSPTLTA